MLQAVILCAGKSTRTYPLTVNRPKPLLKIVNKTILEHNLEALDGLIDEAILVVGFKKEMIEEFTKKIKKKFPFKITLIEQKEQLGTGHAVLTAKPLIKDRFIAMNGDDIFSAEDMKKCIGRRYCVFAVKGDTRKRFGEVVTKDGFVTEIVEKPEEPKTNLINIGLYLFDKKVFEFKPKKSPRGEMEINDMITKLAAIEKVECMVADYWLPVGYPWHILAANEFLLGRTGTKIGSRTKIGKDVKIIDPVSIGNNCKITGCIIGPNVSIGDNCRIGSSVRIINSVVMDGVQIGSHSEIIDSVIGDNVTLGEGNITSNKNADGSNVFTMVRDQKTDTGRKSFGAIIGDGVKTGRDVSFLPGVKAWPEKRIEDRVLVSKDITD